MLHDSNLHYVLCEHLHLFDKYGVLLFIKEKLQETGDLIRLIFWVFYLNSKYGLNYHSYLSVETAGQNVIAKS
jgi:hypothetical protein